MRKSYVIIVAGGSGTRMGSALPKQFLEVNGKPILLYTLEKFYHTDANINIILVLPKEHHATWNGIITSHQVKISHQLTSGGETRFHSVKNGLNLIQEEDVLVAIHDGVRPMVSSKVINTSFEVADQMGNAVPAIKLIDSVREIQHESSKIVDRENLRLIQTPQTFYFPLIKNAYQQTFSSSFTDDASVLEHKGGTINLIEGNAENIKITNQADLLYLKFLLSVKSG